MERLVVSNAKLGIPQDKPVGDINLEQALFRYFHTHSYDLGDAPKRPTPTAPTLTMRERILALSLSPDPLRFSKIKKVIQ